SREPAVNQVQVKARLLEHAVPEDVAESAVRALPARALGVLLYGSYARGDADGTSDLDVLVITGQRLKPPADPRLSINSYSPAELEAAWGTLFAYHLR